MKKLVVFLFILLWAVKAHSAVVELNPSEDVYITSSASADTNFNGGGLVLVDKPDKRRYILLKYDLSSLSGVSKVYTSTMEFTVETTSESSTYFYVLQGLRNFDETTATWNIYSTGNSWTTAGARSDGNDVNGDYTDPANDPDLLAYHQNPTTYSEGTVIRFTSKDALTTLIQNNLGGTIYLYIYGYADNFRTSRFYDTESADSTKWPVLRITYDHDAVIPNATTKTEELLDYLAQTQIDNTIVFGLMYERFANNSQVTDGAHRQMMYLYPSETYKITGKNAMISGQNFTTCDYAGYYCGAYNTSESKTRKFWQTAKDYGVKTHYNQGGIIEMSWNVLNPYTQDVDSSQWWGGSSGEIGAWQEYGKVETPVFTGSGLDDMTAGHGTLGTPEGDSPCGPSADYKVEIDGTGSPNTFKWYIDDVEQATGVSITGSKQELGTSNVFVTFGATTGHTSGDYWTTHLTSPYEIAAPGGDSREWYTTLMDDLAYYFNTTKDKNNEKLVYMFRPYNEMTGNWFWWGTDCTSDQNFKDMWVDLFDYLTTDDIKTASNITLSSGTATFSASQTDHVRLGDTIDYDTDNKKALVTAKTNNTTYTVSTTAGGVPGDVSAVTVNSIKHAVDNLLWVYSPDRTSSVPSIERVLETRYPGDDYVDIIAEDAYRNTPLSSGSSLLSDYKENCYDAWEHGKLCTIAEGYWYFPGSPNSDFWTTDFFNVCMNDEVCKKNVYVMFWSSPRYGPESGRSDEDAFREMEARSDTIFLEPQFEGSIY